MPAPRVRLRPPAAADEAEFLALAAASRRLHGAWVRPPWTPDEFRHYLARAAAEHDRPPAHLCRLVVGADDGRMLGACNVNYLVWGGLRAGALGYYAFAPHAGRGYVREGVALLLTEAFRRVGLHRVEAAVQPRNAASRRLVAALGFRHEGLSPRYLLLAGRWRDHERWALHAEEWRPGVLDRGRDPSALGDTAKGRGAAAPRIVPHGRRAQR